MLICGVDPGLDGALAFLDTATTRIIAMISMPTLTLRKGKGSKREISSRTLVVELERAQLGSVAHVFLEKVSSSPQMGNASAFKFGRGYGIIEGVTAVLGWPVEDVSPNKWKKALAVPAGKDDARARACQLMQLDAEQWTPRRGIMNAAQASGRAEAALIGLYGLRNFQKLAADLPLVDAVA